MTRLLLRAFLLVACTAPLPAAANSSLQPYQMVRSLQVIQDRLADGDHAALPMQRKILEMIDSRLRGATAEDFADKRNFRALLIYGMSGGNPTTLQVAMSRLELPEEDRQLGASIVDYLQGNTVRAMKTLQTLDTRAQPEEVQAFLSLIKGSMVIAEKPSEAFPLFDRARLLAPGTLVEEAALRRTIGLAAQQKDAERFLRAASQYVRRFLASPYASNFADAFVAGILDLHETIDLPRAQEIIQQMNGEQARVVYLRVARRAAIERYDKLVAFAQDGLGQPVASATDEQDPRAVLYESLSSITSEDVGSVKGRLEGIDRERLSANDRKLLDAAMSLATKVTKAPVALEAEPTNAAAPLEPNPREAVARPIETIVERDVKPTRPMATQASADANTPDAEEPSAFVSAARQRLQEVDALLRETKR